MILEIDGFLVLFCFLGCFLFGVFFVIFGCGREGWRGAVWGVNQDMRRNLGEKNNP